MRWPAWIHWVDTEYLQQDGCMEHVDSHVSPPCYHCMPWWRHRELRGWSEILAGTSLTLRRTNIIVICLAAPCARFYVGGRWYNCSHSQTSALPQMWHETLFDELKASAHRCKRSVLWPSNYAKMHFSPGLRPDPSRCSRRSPDPTRLGRGHPPAGKGAPSTYTNPLGPEAIGASILPP